MYRLLGVMTQWPWLALLPATALLVVYRWRRSRVALAVAALWALYAPYEWAMRERILCSGECNIRIDLLLLYPALLLLTVLALVLRGGARGPR